MNQNEIIGGYVGTDPVERIYLGDELVWTNTPPVPDYSQMYFTIEAISAGTIEFMKEGSGSTVVLDYSMDDGVSWTTFTSTTAGTQIQVAAGDKVMFRGENTSFSYGNTNNQFWSGSTAQFKVYGNTMSLLYGDDFQDKTTIGEYAFNSLFKGCYTLISASNLVLPALTVPYMAYGSYWGGMFAGCTSLTTAPALPATTLAESCYERMFYGCTSLTTAPELPATTLGRMSCMNMFSNCTSLTTAPELPATTLAARCYGLMFYGCTSLTTAQSILPATTLASECYENMFAGCTSLTEGPVISGTGPKTTGLNPCMDMFKDCTALTAVTFLFPLNYSTDAWQMYVGYWHGSSTTLPASGVFHKAPGADWGQPGEYWGEGVPAGWTIVDYTPPA